MNHTTGNEGFDRFWEAYPRKIGKGAAHKAWLKLAPPGPQCEEIIASVHDHAKTPKWRDKDGEFIPHPSTFLNQMRWLDEVKSDQKKIASLYTGRPFKRKYEIKPGVKPQSHLCHPNVAKMRKAYEKAKVEHSEHKPMSFARGYLAAINWYEAQHVQCPGELMPTCPACGELHGPYLNPLIEWLMQQYPGETIGWNPYQKGFMLCPECERKGVTTFIPDKS